MNGFDFDIDYVREQFPCLCKTVNGKPAAFLDGPGGTQVPRRVVDRISDYLYYRNANAHGCYKTSKETEALHSEARETFAAFFNCKPEEVAFGESSSGNNFKLALALVRDMKPGDEVIITDIDHECNRSPWRTLQEHGIIVKSVKIDLETYTLDIEDYKSKLSNKTKVVAINWASNATGTVTDVKTMIEMAHAVGALTVIDAVHYAPHKVIDVKNIGTDFLICSAYKFFGPHVGVVYAKAEVLDKVRTIRVLADDNTMVPEKFETGTPNFESICGCAGAIDFIADLGSKHEKYFKEQLTGLSGKRKQIVAGMLAIDTYEEPLAKKLRKELSNIEGITIYGPPEGYERTSTVSFTIAGKNSNDVAKFLAERGIYVWDGDFYAIEITNHVLKLGSQGGLVRVGLAPYNTIDDIERTIKAVSDFCKL
ncbi:MAG: cysteine desulfurase-like protein [Eubacteriales bacterium]|nr:cysteine desulfurase-like protein [Eubacteriales bacterium]